MLRYNEDAILPFLSNWVTEKNGLRQLQCHIVAVLCAASVDYMGYPWEICQGTSSCVVVNEWHKGDQRARLSLQLKVGFYEAHGHGKL